ncbi:reverse transcriptase [Plakobranchus ocellatus]|uniref:Reverse transcriptase n=1 Tax=Plakobranchus ocellatus TaxID=259542 RepID=A0AAV4C1V1_9GAST|nr:reverse transcriptase [Plakobranchus ocellatus]
MAIFHAKGLPIQSKARALISTSEGGTKSWCESAASIDTQRKILLDGCDDWEFSADLFNWNRRSKVIHVTGIRPDIVFHSSTTRQIIMFELTVPYLSRI